MKRANNSGLRYAIGNPQTVSNLLKRTGFLSKFIFIKEYLAKILIGKKVNFKVFKDLKENLIFFIIFHKNFKN